MGPDYFSQPIYLDLGGALAAFGLIFAVYQLRKPRWDLVLRIRRSWQRNLFWILGGVGLTLVLARILLPQEWLEFLPTPFNDPLTYEVIAYLFFIASPLSLLYFSIRTRGLFNKKTPRKFYESLVWEISKTSDDNVDAALEILLSNFHDICRAIREHKEKEEVRQFASAILDVILSDSVAVKILTTKRLDALQHILATIEEHNINKRDAGIGIPRIVRNLFYDNDSFFYKHLNREGLALPLNIYEGVFSSPIILTNFDLFNYPTLEYSMRKEFGVTGVGVLIEALSRSIKTYLKTGKVPPRHINDGLARVSEIFDDICLAISIDEGRGVDTRYSLKDEWWTLSCIANFLGHDYPFLAYQEELNQEVTKKEKTVPEASFCSNVTINAGIAGALYKAFEGLSYIENTFDIHHVGLKLLHGMMYESERKEGYRPPFEKRIWEQIAANIIHRHYPATLRAYLHFVGFRAASGKSQVHGGWLDEQTERVRRLLYVDLKPLLDADAKMVNGEKMKDTLLPKSMRYEDGQFKYTFGFGKGETEIIPPPPQGATSALVGVNLDHPSLL